MAYNIIVAEGAQLVTAVIERGQDAILIVFDDPEGSTLERLCRILKAIGVERLVCLAKQVPDSKFGFVLDQDKKVFAKQL